MGSAGLVGLYSKAAVRKNVEMKKSSGEERIFELRSRGAWETHTAKINVNISRRRPGLDQPDQKLPPESCKRCFRRDEADAYRPQLFRSPARF